MFDLYIFSFFRALDPKQIDLPGLLVVPPPKQGGRGRDGDLLILYLTMVSPAGYPTDLHDLLQKVSQEYYKSHGTITAGLRTLAEQLNNTLLERNLKQAGQTEPLHSWLSIAALRGNTVYLLQAGPAHAIVLTGDEMQEFCDPFANGRGLGAGSSLDLHYNQLEIATGDVLVFSPNPPASWTQAALTGVPRLSLEHLRRRLLNQAGDDLQAVVVKFQPGKGQIHLLRPRAAQPPLAASVPPPTPTNPLADEPAPTAPPALPPEPAVEATPIREQFPLPIESGTNNVDETQIAASAVETPATSQITASTVEITPAPQAVETVVPAVSQQPISRSERIRLARQGLPIPEPVVETPAPRNQPVRPRPTGAGRKRAASTWLGLKKVGAWMENGWNGLLRRISPTQGEQAPALSSAAMLFIAILVPVLVVAIATTVYYQSGRSEQRQAYYVQALQFSANAVSQPDLVLQRNNWEQALLWLEKAEELGTTDETRTLHMRVQQGLDTGDGIQRLDFKPINRYGFASGVKITRMAASSSDIYMLDSAQGRILRLFLTATGYELDTGFTCGPGPSGNLFVTALVDLAIVPPNTRKATVIGVDASGMAILCTPGGAQVAFPLPEPDIKWGKITAFTLNQDSLYVLDVIKNGVWRLDSRSLEFKEEPVNFFDKSQPSLSNVVDLAFYGEDLYLLRENGQITQCTAGRTQLVPTRCTDPAKLGDSRPGRHPEPVTLPDAIFIQAITTQPPDPSLYLLDVKGPGIYHYSLRLNFQRQLRPNTAGDTRIPREYPTAFTITPTRLAVLAYGNQVYYAQMP